MTSLTSYKDFSDEELSKKYLENLALYDDQIVIMETLTTKVREVRMEIHFLQEQLLKRGYKIKDVDVEETNKNKDKKPFSRFAEKGKKQ